MLGHLLFGSFFELEIELVQSGYTMYARHFFDDRQSFGRSVSPFVRLTSHFFFGEVLAQIFPGIQASDHLHFA